VRETFIAAGGHPDDAKQLGMSYYSIKKILIKSSEDMKEFLSKILPKLIEKGSISLQIDTKHIGQRTSGDRETGALGTLIVFYDSSKNERFTYLVDYAPIRDKTDKACAEEVHDVMEEYGIKEYQRKIGIVTDAGQRGVGEIVTLLSAICGAHSTQCAIEGMIEMSELYCNLDKELFINYEKFVAFCRTGLTMKERKKLKLTAMEPHSISDFFFNEKLPENEEENQREKKRIYSLKNDTSGMTDEEIKKKSDKIGSYPQLRSDNGIRWSKNDENLSVLVAWTPKLLELSESTHKYSYLIPSRVTFPDLDFVHSLRILSSELLKYTRLLEDPSAKVDYQDLN
jgi:hypothetical protein